ncbi:MAG TPA: phosphoribosylformylglycinamidine cyclo-ligase [Acidimicrobiia bacterium]|nr:phosphoribosylformylglycinamidine cyclo-ligase [Acidimicrobiia bacterium]
MTSYRAAGVDLEAADHHVTNIAGPVTSTWNESVVGGFGGFAAGVFLPPGLKQPVLMMTTDGVGTKLELARKTGYWGGVGFDLVAMVVDDLAATGARPLGVVDYMAVGALDPVRDTTIIESIATACLAADCPLLGGETAEHPGTMAPDQVDLAATALGVVEHGHELGADRVELGDVVIGLASPNVRSNGFSLVRAAVGNRDLSQKIEGTTLGELLLLPSVIYSPAVLRASEAGLVHAAAHITGGGVESNLARVIPAGLRAEIDFESWSVPSVFQLIAARGGVTDHEMWSTFNMGMGFCLVTPPGQANDVIELCGHDARVIGQIVSR